MVRDERVHQMSTIDDITAMLNPELANVQKVFPEAEVVYTGPTTDEMDHTTPEDRYKLVVACVNGHWHHFTGSRDRFSQTEGETCGECGTKNFLGRTLISERTWNPKAKITMPKKKR